MSNELVVVNVLEVPAFQNKYLEESVRRIVACSRNIVANNFQIAYELANIKSNELYKEDGYESVTEFAEKVFGFSKTSTSLAIKVAERYLIDEGNRIATTFLDSGTDFSFNQLRETLPLSRMKVDKLVSDKKLNSLMTVREIRALVQEEKKKELVGVSTVETEENRGIIDVTADSIVSSDNEEEDSQEQVQATNLSADESTPSQSFTNASVSPQNAPESTETGLGTLTSQSNETALAEVHELKNSEIDFLINRINEDSSEEYPLCPYEYRFYNCQLDYSETKKVYEIELSELVESDRAIPKEMKECFELLRKEIRRLNHFSRKESARLEEQEREIEQLKAKIVELTPVRRGRGRPRKNQ